MLTYGDDDGSDALCTGTTQRPLQLVRQFFDAVQRRRVRDEDVRVATGSSGRSSCGSGGVLRQLLLNQRRLKETGTSLPASQQRHSLVLDIDQQARHRPVYSTAYTGQQTKFHYAVWSQTGSMLVADLLARASSLLAS